MALEEQFWKHKALQDMSPEEWDALCDGCARCCLHKALDEEKKKVYYTNIACRYLDIESCRCTVYEHRKEHTTRCADLWTEDICELLWLPESCAYRLLYEGKDLPVWHPLMTGDPDSTRDEGMSIRNYAIPEEDAGPFEEHIIG